MKKTIIAILALSGIAMGEVTVSTHTTSGSTTVAKGTEIADGVKIAEDMTFGSNSSFQAAKNDLVTTDITLGNYYIGNYTISLWLTGDSFTNNHVLFTFSHSFNADSYGYNALVWDAENKAITLGRGNFGADADSVTFTDNAGTATGLGEYISTAAEAVNITLASTQTGTTDDLQTATLYINGEKVHTFNQLTTKMNGGGGLAHPDTYTSLSQSSTAKYGTVKLTNEALSAEKISGFAGIVPEPATATLSLLALAGLAARRRRH